MISQALTLEETAPALSQGESVSSVSVLATCGPELSKLLADPSSGLLADEDIECIPHAKVKASDDAWGKVCNELDTRAVAGADVVEAVATTSCRIAPL
jgi:DNA-binding protein YbaB